MNFNLDFNFHLYIDIFLHIKNINFEKTIFMLKLFSSGAFKPGSTIRSTEVIKTDPLLI